MELLTASIEICSNMPWSSSLPRGRMPKYREPGQFGRPVFSDILYFDSHLYIINSNDPKYTIKDFSHPPILDLSIFLSQNT